MNENKLRNALWAWVVISIIGGVVTYAVEKVHRAQQRKQLEETLNSTSENTMSEQPTVETVVASTPTTEQVKPSTNEEEDGNVIYSDEDEDDESDEYDQDDYDF